MVFIVAELGANWGGNLDTLDLMAIRCARAGVSAIKLQALSPELLDRHPEWNWYRDASVTKDNIKAIDEHIKVCGLEWFATPCYPEAVELLDPYVKRYKIR